MSIEDAKAFYKLMTDDKSVRAEVRGAWHQMALVAQKHGLIFTHAEYYDFLHEHTGMQTVSKSDDQDDTDTCITILPSEAPGF